MNGSGVHYCSSHDQPLNLNKDVQDLLEMPFKEVIEVLKCSNNSKLAYHVRCLLKDVIEGDDLSSELSEKSSANLINEDVKSPMNEEHYHGKVKDYDDHVQSNRKLSINMIQAFLLKDPTLKNGLLDSEWIDIMLSLDRKLYWYDRNLWEKNKKRKWITTVTIYANSLKQFGLLFRKEFVGKEEKKEVTAGRLKSINRYFLVEKWEQTYKSITGEEYKFVPDEYVSDEEIRKSIETKKMMTNKRRNYEIMKSQKRTKISQE